MRLAVLPPCAILLATVLALGGCGHSSDQTPSPTPSSSSGGASVDGSASVPAHAFVPVPLTATKGGTLTLRLTVSRNIVVAGIVPAACAAGTRSACTPLSYTESATSDTSKTLTAAGASAGSYVVIFGNLGTSTQTVSFSGSLG